MLSKFTLDQKGTERKEFSKMLSRVHFSAKLSHPDTSLEELRASGQYSLDEVLFAFLPLLIKGDGRLSLGLYRSVNQTRCLGL